VNPKTIAIAKKITSFVVGFGVSKIVAGIIESNVAVEKTHEKVAVASASYVLGFAISEHTSEFTDKQIDNAVDWWTENVTNRSK